MRFFSVARKNLGEWWRGPSPGQPAPSPQLPAKDPGAPDKWERIEAFVETLYDETANPLGRLRLVSFNILSDRIGPRWPKLRGKIELLAEKLLKDDKAAGDRYLNIGNAEFLVYYAEASPDEIRIRCWAIMERIQEKLFGVDEALLGARAPATPGPTADRDMANAKGLLRFIRREGEKLDRAAFVASARKAIDSILAEAIDAQTEAHLMGARIERFSRDLDVISGALLATGSGPALEAASLSAELEELKQDATRLATILCPEAGGTPPDLPDDLIIVRTWRAARDARKAADAALPRLKSGFPAPSVFEYVPVVRSLSFDDRIFQRIFRVNCTGPGAQTEDDVAAKDMVLLEHAVNFLADRKAATNSLLMVPVHVDTLLNPSFRERYLALLRAAGWVKRLIVLEVLGSEAMEGSAQLGRALEQLDADVLALFVALPYETLPDIQQIAVECKRAGVHAVGVDIFHVKEMVADSVLRQIASVCQQWSLLSYVSGVARAAISDKATAAGIAYTCEANIRTDLPLRPCA